MVPYYEWPLCKCIYMEQNPSWKLLFADLINKFPIFNRSQKIQYRFRISSPLGPLLKHFNIIYAVPPYLFQVNFLLCLGAQNGLCLPDLRTKMFYICLIVLMYGCSSCLFQTLKFDHPNNTYEGYKLWSLQLCKFPHPIVIVYPLCPHILSEPCSETNFLQLHHCMSYCIFSDIKT